jgi:ABC-type phosphate transport system substrate-binding protein
MLKKKRQKKLLSLNFLLAALIFLILLLSIQLMFKSTPIKLKPGITEITVAGSTTLKPGETQVITGYVLKSGVVQITVS